MPEFASDDGFVQLFRFCVDLGGDTAEFVDDARQFHDKLGHPKCRRMRLIIVVYLTAAS